MGVSYLIFIVLSLFAIGFYMFYLASRIDLDSIFIEDVDETKDKVKPKKKKEYSYANKISFNYSDDSEWVGNNR
jgi:hypothetical protein